MAMEFPNSSDSDQVYYTESFAPLGLNIFDYRFEVAGAGN